MKKFILFLILLFPVIAFGKSYEGSYRVVFFNLFSESRMIVAEFEVKADNSLNGKIKIDESVKTFSGTVGKNGKFEAIIEQSGNYTYKLKGKFDKDNKISLVQRNQTGSGLNKSGSESTIKGKFSKILSAETNSSNPDQPKVELTDNGQSRLKIEHDNPMFGSDWTDFTASVGFDNLYKTPGGSESKKVTGTIEASDYFVLLVKSKTEGQQTLRIVVLNYAPDKKIWGQKELGATSYREVKGEQKNSFLTGATLQAESHHDEGRLEIVRETETQIILKLTDFKIKRLFEEDSVTLNGFIYADK